VRAAWTAAAVDQRRAVLREHLARIEVGPGTPGAFSLETVIPRVARLASLLCPIVDTRDAPARSTRKGARLFVGDPFIGDVPSPRVIFPPTHAAGAKPRGRRLEVNDGGAHIVCQPGEPLPAVGEHV
jgi:hypothetical protein